MANGYYEVYKRIKADLAQKIDETRIKQSNNSATAEEINFLTRVSSQDD